jgi:hypothetical protein
MPPLLWPLPLRLRSLAEKILILTDAWFPRVNGVVRIFSTTNPRTGAPGTLIEMELDITNGQKDKKISFFFESVIEM